MPYFHFSPGRFAFQDRQFLYMILPKVEGRSLSDYLDVYGAFSRLHACYYFAELLMAVREMHAHMRLCRDIKPSNIILNPDNHVTVVGLGMSLAHEVVGLCARYPNVCILSDFFSIRLTRHIYLVI